MTIFSMEVENELIQLGETGSRVQWRIGCIVARRIETEETARMLAYTDAAKLTGRSIRSIRRYVTTYEFYTDKLYPEYDIFPFEYFAIVKEYGPRWQELLDACLKQMEHIGGGLPGVDWLRVYTDPSIITEPEIDARMPQEPTEGDETLYSCEIDTLEPVLTPAAVDAVVRRMTKHQQALAEIVNSIPLDGEVLIRVLSTLEQLEGMITDIARDLTKQTFKVK